MKTNCGSPPESTTNPNLTEQIARSNGNASYIFFGGRDINFLEYYESKMKEHQLLTILKDDLTEKGLESYKKINKYLTENLDKYMLESQK